LRSLQTLGDTVRAMKSLSARHFREARNEVAPCRAYREGVERILARTGATLVAGSGPAGLLVIGSELGLCGGYNVRLVRAGAKRRAELGPGPTLCVGRRVATQLARLGVDVARAYGAPVGVGDITDLLLRLAGDIVAAYADQGLSRFDVVSSRFGGVGADRPAAVRLLPLESRSVAGAPVVRYVTREHLVSAAVREVLFVAVYDLLLDALASEHGARLVATQSAERWIDERSERLRRHLVATRREASTQEVIELASGARARSRQP
jgi:F-type H+-transporting ATPase subunit gamma